ncbi:hypothetical protein COCOBI_07-6340 [Coccomyxa sp. Obi]|nr:hypothetical protein COCOBI_07-6340 [Coccomyxa sp. Obi]
MAKVHQAEEKETEFHKNDEVLVLVDSTEQQPPDVSRGKNGLKPSKSFYFRRSDAHQRARREDGTESEAAELLAEDRCEGMEYEDFRTDLNEAIQDALTGAVQEVMQEAVTEAVQAAVDEGIKFDVRANLYTIMAITGVVLYWRGIWTTWDFFFGFTIWSELGAILTGLAIMIAFRLFKMPLLDGLPSG